ncbi:MAG: host-nuclease inhibitor Gam family protein [Pyrinomonadaceae bacterium]
MSEELVDSQTVYIEGFGYVDAETGELVTMEGDIPNGAMESTNEFDENDVEWALSKLFRLDGDIVASEARLKAELDAITKNYKPTVNRLVGAKNSFLTWVKPQLQRYAERVLAAKNTKADGTPVAKPEKSVKLPKGTLAFRAVNQVSIATPEGGARAVDAAVEWVKENYPHALRSVWVLDLDKLSEEDRATIQAVTAEEKSFVEVGWNGPCPLKVTLPGDKFDVRTGVK